MVQVVLATDGLFDNLFEADVLRTVGSGRADVATLAKQLAEAALAASLDKHVDSPFALLAKVHCAALH